ncbi:MAG: hypothetical protein FJX74_02085 [Armatimonadetes bacterium]|nr:hypothetical protein [Armatimonadota bacterium]
MSREDAPAEYPYQTFRRASWPWAVAGVLLILGAGVYTGSDLSELARQKVGQHLLTATWFALSAVGGLCLLVATSIFMEHVGLDDAAIEQIRMGRRDVRLLWKDVDRVVLHKSRKRPKGAVEVRGPQGRTVVADPRLRRFNDLETAILERAEFFRIEVKSHR